MLDGAADVAVEIEVDLSAGFAEGGWRNGPGELAGVFDDGGHELRGGEDPVDEAETVGLLREEDAAGEEDFHGGGEADEAREEPGEAVFRGQGEAAVRGGEFGAGSSEADVAVAGEDEADTCGRAVDGGDGGLGEAEVIGEVVVEVGCETETWTGNVLGGAWVVAALFEVAFERAGISPGTEAAAGAGDDDDAHGRVGIGLLKAPTVLRVHAAGPGVEALGAVEGDDGDAAVDGEGGDFELHGGDCKRRVTR